MHSREDTIKQALEGMEPNNDATPPVAISGTVSQVNIISHATFNIDAVNIAPPHTAQEADQGERLAELVHTLAVMEGVTSDRRVTSESVWFRLKNALGLPAEQQIPLDRQPEAVDTMLHRLTLARGDLQRDPQIARKRSGCYRRCHGIARQYGLYAEMRQHMARQWGAKSMRNLADEELWSLEAYMRLKEEERKRRGSKLTRLRPWPERP